MFDVRDIAVNKMKILCPRHVGAEGQVMTHRNDQAVLWTKAILGSVAGLAEVVTKGSLRK
jgi:hypothetical protein